MIIYLTVTSEMSICILNVFLYSLCLQNIKLRKHLNKKNNCLFHINIQLNALMIFNNIEEHRLLQNTKTKKKLLVYTIKRRINNRKKEVIKSEKQFVKLKNEICNRTIHLNRYTIM
jgi:hypothetical protein